MTRKPEGTTDAPVRKDRRDFLKFAGSAAPLAAVGPAFALSFAHQNSSPQGIGPMMYFGASVAMRRCPASTQNSNGKMLATRLKQRNLCSSGSGILEQ